MIPSNPIPKSVPKKYKPRIMHWDDERGAGNGIIVMLAYGWCYDFQEHTRGFDTVAEAVQGVKWTDPCACPSCVAKK